MTDDERFEWEERQNRKLDAKYLPKGLPIYVLHRRTANTAYSVLRKLDGIPFEHLELELLVFCEDSGFKEFAWKYQRVLEIASLQPDKFLQQLYKFFVDTAKFIRDNGYLARYMSFLSFFLDKQVDERDERQPIYSAYADLLLQQMTFLQPNKFQIDQLLVGVTTEGEPITIADPFPSSDLPLYELQRMIREKELRGTSAAAITKLYARYGYNGIDNMEKIEHLQLTSQFFSNNVNYLAAVINEYTLDILPKKPFIPEINLDEWPRCKPAEENFYTLLCSRRRTLPANGLLMTLEHSKKYRQILLKETFHNGSIVLLYRIEDVSTGGCISGLYNTRTGLFYSPFRNAFKGEPVHERIEILILWMYAAYVCNESTITPTEESYLRFIEDDPAVVVKFSAIPGKLRKVIRDGDGSSRQFDEEKYETEIRSIAGYIRRLPVGQKPSEEAIGLAESLGLLLEPGETYVRPFVRSTWILREPEKHNEQNT